jgi:hypothetical protein
MSALSLFWSNGMAAAKGRDALRLREAGIYRCWLAIA